MVVCKFFLQGTCKYGDYCKFEHQVKSGYTSFSDHSSILRQPSFGAPQTTNVKQTSNVDKNTLIKSVVNDMIQNEKGGQWLLSCYAPFKEKPAFPGFTDYSFEEIRNGFYEAQRNGTLDQYKQQLQSMLQEVVMKGKSLQNPSPDMIDLIQRIYNSPPSNCSGVFAATNTQNVFGNAGNSNFTQQPFGAQQNSNSIFGKTSSSVFGGATHQQTSTFGGGATNIFGGTTQSVFGGQTQAVSPNQQSSIFGASTGNNSIFGQASQPVINSGSIFGGQAQSNMGQSVFGAQPQQQPSSPFGQQANSPFGQQSSIFGQPNQNPPQKSGSIFGGQPFSQTSSVFTPQTQSSPFGSPQQAPALPQAHVSPFGSTQQTRPPQNTIFGGSAAPQSFGSPQQNLAASQPQAALFRPQQAPQPGIFGAQTTPNLFGSNTAPIQPQTSSVFGQTQPSIATPANHSASIFGAPPTQPTNAIGTANQPGISASPFQSSNIFGRGQNEVVDESLYSKLEELTDEEKKWFESDDLDVFSIPEKPPTRQMCLKV